MKITGPNIQSALEVKPDQKANQPVRSLEQEKKRLLKAAKEFESFFKYYMLKTMRETIPKDGLSDDIPLGNEGQDAFTDMFDMEMSKAGSGGRRSIADVIFRSLEKNVEARYSAQTGKAENPAHALPKMISTVRPPVSSIPLHTHLTVPARPNSDPIPISPKEVLTPHQPKVTTPAPQTSVAERPVKPRTKSVIDLFGDHIEAAARDTNLDSTLIASVIQAESGGDPKAISKAGAKGLMQLTDSTATDLGVTNVFDPAENILAGSRYLKKLIDRYQDPRLALAAYNAGPGNVDKYGGIPPFKETKEYVAKVTNLTQKDTPKRVSVAKGTNRTTDNQTR